MFDKNTIVLGILCAMVAHNSWAMDSQSLFVSTMGPSGVTLLHVDLNGHAQPIWQWPQTSWTWGLSSPDGRHIAMLGAISGSNAWMIGDF